MPRPLDAEVLLDGISGVSGVDEVFTGSDYHTREGIAPYGTRAIDLVPELYPSQFLDIYGRNSRATVQIRKVQANLGQSLHLLVGPTYTGKIFQEGGRVDRLIKNHDSNRQII